MSISLLMKRATSGLLPMLVLMSASSVADAKAIPASKLLESVQAPVTKTQTSLENLQATLRQGFGFQKSPSNVKTQRPHRVIVNSTVTAEVIVDEDFSKWTAGTQSDPSTEMVTEEQVPSLMSYPGDWVAFRMYEAGGAGYMGFDEIGGDGPGYLQSPSINVKDEGADKGYWRFSCRVKNVNENDQEQGLQAFIFNEETSSIISASAKPIAYQEWSECEWVGATSTTQTTFMAFGWQGKMLIDRFKVEKLTFPLATPVVTGASLLPDCSSVEVTWEKVENATSYDIEVTLDSETIYTCQAGDVDHATLDFLVESADDYVVYITARNGEECSYPGYWVGELAPEYVGNAVAKDATNVDANGFTANWEAADYATNYLVMPTVKHTAKENGEEFYYLNELFSNVPESADSYAPIIVAPMLGYDSANLYMSRAGWTIDMGIFVRLAPEMPVLALSSQYAPYGLEGSLISPVANYSVGNGTVKLTGYGLSSADDVVMLCGFMDEGGNIYSSETFEVSMDGTPFEIELSGGLENSKFVLKISESAEGGDMVIIPMLSLSTTLNEGDQVTAPVETVFAGHVTDARVDVPVDDYNHYSYCVQGYFSPELMGGVSESV